MNRPTFDSLPSIQGTDQKLVNGRLMDREEYDTCEWHIAGHPATGDYYEVDHPTQGRMRVPYWRATLEGLNRYSALRVQRRADKKAAWQAREEQDDEFSRYVDALDDAKAGH